MKKIVLTLAALMSMTMTFAKGEASAKSNEAAPAEDSRYEMNINVNSLGRALGLDLMTKDAVGSVSELFHNDMHKVATTSDEAERDMLYKKALKRNISNMRGLLDSDQYHVYLTLLNTTINNRGLNK